MLIFLSSEAQEIIKYLGPTLRTSKIVKLIFIWRRKLFKAKYLGRPN